MADRPLRPATHRSLGEPLPHQQANGPRAHLDAEAEASFPLAGTSGISPSFLGLSRSSRQVTHVLLTRSRLCPRASPGSSLHLHVLSTPPAFVLSQDQTLREKHFTKSCHGCQLLIDKRWARGARSLYTTAPGHDGVLLYLTLFPPCADWVGLAGRTWTHTRSNRPWMRMLLSFQRPSHLFGRGFLPGGTSETVADSGADR